MLDPFADGQITHLLSLLSGGRKRPFAVEMLAAILNADPPADGAKASARRQRRGPRRDAGPFCKGRQSVGKSEMLGRFICGFVAARADRRDLEIREHAQGRNVGIAPPAVAHICSDDANTDFLCRHFLFLCCRCDPKVIFPKSIPDIPSDGYAPATH
jgi:hypothetical protein